MRLGELINALSCFIPGIEACINTEQAVVWSLYEPNLRGQGETFFDAASDLAKQMIQHPNCPSNVKTALEAYDDRSCILAL